MKRSLVLATAAAVAIVGVAPVQPVVAAGSAAAMSLEQVRARALAEMKAGNLQEVGKRSWRGRGAKRGRSWRGRSYRGRRYYGGRRHYRRNGGAAVAAGIAGLAIGAAIANSGPRSYRRSSAWCAERYRSYNPRTGTYRGYDGLDHPCP